jgi:hypothetical protein
MGRVQGAFTAITEIAAGKVEDLRARLLAIDAQVSEPKGPIPFHDLTTVHFMRWVILDATHDAAGKPMPPTLILSTNYDEPQDTHLGELVRIAGSEFDAIYRNCIGYKASSDAERVDYLRRHSVGYAAFYVGTRGRGVEQIRREADLRDRIETYLNGIKTTGMTPEQIHATLRKTFTSGADAWVTEPAGHLPGYIPLKRFLFWVIVLAILSFGGVTVVLLGAVFGFTWSAGWLLLAVAVCGVLALLALGLVIRGYETFERIPRVPLVGAPVGAQVDREDQVVQNQLTNVVFIKPSRFRHVAIRLFLFIIHQAGRRVFVRGALGGIPTIHFARWVIVDGGRRVLFMSNFDGSWENYLGDFIDKASVGLTGIWSNTIGCPPARFLVLDGAHDEAAFKVWVRQNQLVTQVWYSAYRDLTVENINTNTRIRLGLQAPLTGQDATDWLALL